MWSLIFNRIFILPLVCGLLSGLACSCSSDPSIRTVHPGTYDPSSGCQQALSHVITLSLQATGSGPTNQQREMFVQRCVATGSDRGSQCVLRLKRLPGVRGGKVNLGPALSCLGGRR